MTEEEFSRIKWKFARNAFRRMEDGRYFAFGDLNDGRGLVIDIREEKDLPPEPTGQILINLELSIPQ